MAVSDFFCLTQEETNFYYRQNPKFKASKTGTFMIEYSYSYTKFERNTSVGTKSDRKKTPELDKTT